MRTIFTIEVFWHGHALVGTSEEEFFRAMQSAYHNHDYYRYQADGPKHPDSYTVITEACVVCMNDGRVKVVSKRNPLDVKRKTCPECYGRPPKAVWTIGAP